MITLARDGSTARRARRGAFTLVEVAIATLLFAMLLGSIGLVATESQDRFQLSMAQSHLDAKARRAVDRMVVELRSAGVGGLLPAASPPQSNPTLTYQRNTGYDFVAGQPTWGPNTRLSFEYAPGEFDNGFDDDGNGLIDDGLLVWTESPGAAELRVVLARGVAETFAGELADGVLDENGNGLVDERGLFFSIDEESLTLGLTLGQAVPGRGPIAASVTTTVVLKN